MIIFLYFKFIKFTTDSQNFMIVIRHDLRRDTTALFQLYGPPLSTYAALKLSIEDVSDI
jgi:hypothetical protein